MKTTKITLSWKSPEPGRATITLPATDSAEIEGLHQYLRATFDTDYGDVRIKASIFLGSSTTSGAACVSAGALVSSVMWCS